MKKSDIEIELIAELTADLRRRDEASRQRHERRLANGTEAKPRPRCTCPAYPFPHRPKGGLCRFPDPPQATFQGQAGKNSPSGMRRNSAIRRRLLKQHRLHPIRDREKIRRWLPKLYAGYCRRHGYPYPEWWLGGHVPAMRVTADGRKY